MSVVIADGYLARSLLLFDSWLALQLPCTEPSGGAASRNAAGWSVELGAASRNGCKRNPLG